MSNYRHLLTKTVEKLSESNSYQGLFHQYKDGEPLPSGKTLHHIIDLARSILFPGYFGNSTIHSQTIQYHIGVNIEELFALLTEQIQAGLCFGERNIEQKKDSISCKDKAVQLAVQFIDKLPEIRHTLSTDVEAAYYGDPAYTETGKLTQSVDLNPDDAEEADPNLQFAAGTIVQTMVEQPRFYYKVVPLLLEKIADGDGYHMRKARYYVTDTPHAGFKLHPAFIQNGVEKDKIYLSAFEGSLWDASASAYILDDSQVADFSNDMLCSIANAKPISGLTQTLTRANLRALAQKRGAGWESQYCATVSATQMLMLIEYAALNMQSAIGRGAVDKTDDGATNMAEPTGATTLLGNASGTANNANGIQFVTYRGEENMWGNIWKFVDGMNINAKGIHNLYVADNDFADSVITGAYKDTGITLAKADGYISAFGYVEEFDWLMVTSETVGNSSLPVGDYFYQNNAYDGVMVARLGGYWRSGTSAGPWYWAVSHPPGYRDRYIGGRPVYIPQA